MPSPGSGGHVMKGVVICHCRGPRRPTDDDRWPASVSVWMRNSTCLTVSTVVSSSSSSLQHSTRNSYDGCTSSASPSAFASFVSPSAAALAAGSAPSSGADAAAPSAPSSRSDVAAASFSSPEGTASSPGALGGLHHFAMESCRVFRAPSRSPCSYWMLARACRGSGLLGQRAPACSGKGTSARAHSLHIHLQSYASRVSGHIGSMCLPKEPS